MSADGEINVAIVAAATDPVSRDGRSLAELYALVCEAGVADTLALSTQDALNILSVLLPIKDPAARDLIAIMGKWSSAKEVVMVVQEEVEKIIEQAMNDEDNEDHTNATAVEKTSWVERLLELVDLYHAAIPRLKLRKKAASEMLKPLLFDLQRAMNTVSCKTRAMEARALMTSVDIMVNSVLKWVKGTPNIENEEVTKCQLALKSVLDSALILFRPLLRYNTGQRALGVCFPRLKMTAQATTSDDDRGVMDSYVSTYADLCITQSQFASSPSLVSLILFVHTWLTSSSSIPLARILPSFLPSLTTMLQSSSRLHDDAIAFLLLVLHQNRVDTRSELLPEIINTLMPVLVALSSAHPSPLARHQAFRALSLLLGNSPAQLRLQLLADLLANCEYPQMRVAAISLVKDAVLEALESQSTGTLNPFGTHMFMRVFGPLLFRPSPSDLFVRGVKLDLEEFFDSPEPKRIIEVLSLYYVVLRRDENNETGVRDKDMLVTVEKELLSPLRSWLESGHEHSMPLTSLQMGLKRIQEAKLNLESSVS